ncbi:MAG: YncE family protein [Ignavibacteria bacterium]|nr:YncE family protein [Ignavibacteria bacterium]
MKRNIIRIIFIISIVYITGCSRDDVTINTPVAGVTSEGAYILSEGGFSAGSSKLSFFNSITGNFSLSIFNPGSLGLFTDGMILESNNLYITEQGNFGVSGKIYKTDTNGTVIVSNNAGINPYSLTAANGKLYVTNGPANNVSVIDQNSLTTNSTISVGVNPQEIQAIGSKVFVCNTSEFMGATDSTVSVIDANSDIVTAVIKVRQTPSSLAVSNDMKLLVGCPGVPASGIIYKIDPSSYAILDSFVIDNGFASGFGKDIAVDRSSDNIYFISNLNNIVRLNLITKEASVFIYNTNTATDYFYGYNYDSKNVRHYITDANDFVSNGSLLVYDGNATLLNTFTTGIAPRRIVIKN